MSDVRKLSLAKMREGQEGTVVEILGGGGLLRRLEAMGIRPGGRITKESGLFGRGPVIARVGNTTIALGYGMASKVMVEVEG